MPKDFTQISPNVLVSFGEGLAEVEGAEGPNVIIICGWLGANLTHLEKYTRVYRERHSNAIIFLVRSYHNFFWSFEQTITSKLMPLVACLDTLGCIKFPNGRPPTLIDPPLPATLSPISTPRILLHSFSNGGSLNVVALAKLLSSMGCTPVRHVSAVIIDSSPGGNFTTTKRAFSGFVKNPLLKALALVFIHVFYFSLYLRGKLLGHRSPFQEDVGGCVEDRINTLPIVPTSGDMYATAEDTRRGTVSIHHTNELHMPKRIPHSRDVLGDFMELIPSDHTLHLFNHGLPSILSSSILRPLSSPHQWLLDQSDLILVAVVLQRLEHKALVHRPEAVTVWPIFQLSTTR
ncbi:hypothetical protein AB1N83_005521 [Pleurotus pulmonarius]